MCQYHSFIFFFFNKLDVGLKDKESPEKLFFQHFLFFAKSLLCLLGTLKMSMSIMGEGALHINVPRLVGSPGSESLQPLFLKADSRPEMLTQGQFEVLSQQVKIGRKVFQTA